MPDVDVFYGDLAFRDELRRDVKRRIKEIVAAWMDCRDDNDRMIIHDPETKIDIGAFQHLSPEDSGKSLVLRIFAYDYPDRMRNIGTRLNGIGEQLSDGLMVPGHAPISLSFVPLPRATPGQEACWVKVESRAAA